MERKWEEKQWRGAVKSIFMVRFKLDEHTSDSIAESFDWEDWKDGYDPAEAVEEEVSCWGD